MNQVGLLGLFVGLLVSYNSELWILKYLGSLKQSKNKNTGQTHRESFNNYVAQI